jgi:hypothetical protein
MLLVFNARFVLSPLKNFKLSPSLVTAFKTEMSLDGQERGCLFIVLPLISASHWLNIHWRVVSEWSWSRVQ